MFLNAWLQSIIEPDGKERVYRIALVNSLESLATYRHMNMGVFKKVQ